MVRCATCGSDCPPEARFCMSCGAEVPQDDGLEVRKTVTILFSDVVGSTAMGDALDPEAVRRVMGQYFDACHSVIEFHGGTIEKFIGDAVMAVFGVPVVHEDDAMRAMRAADGIREALARLNEDFERQHGVRLVVRTGINTGEVMAGDPGAGQPFVSGDAVNVAARLEQVAPPGEILLSGSTLGLVRDAVDVEPVEPLALKGKPEPFAAFRLVSVDAAGEGVARRSEEALVGRSEELSQLVQACERAVDQRRCWMVTVIGEPGVGKSRLVDAFAELVAPRATVLRGRCLSYGTGITFFPAAEIVAQVIGSGEDDTSSEIREKIERAIADTDDGPLVSTRLLRMLGLGHRGFAGSPRGDLLGGPQAARERGAARARRGGDRRHPVGRTGVAGSAGARMRSLTRGADRAGVHDSARHRRRATRVGCRPSERVGHRARTLGRRGFPGPGASS